MTYQAVAASRDALGIQPSEGGPQSSHRSIQPILWHDPVPEVIDPACVVVRQVDTGVIQRLQPAISRAVWRPAPGRKMGFIVEHQGVPLVILFLSSPVVNLAVRDDFLDLPKDASERGKALRNYADLSACVGIQPAAWYWNLGKLGALVATTLGDFFEERYGDQLMGITTTSVWGKGAQYNRVYKFLGYTKGYGHEHIGDVQYARMIRWMRHNGVVVPSSRFGDGSNPRMRRIMAYRKASGDENATVYHGNKRGVYYHPAQPASDRAGVITAWHSRWGAPRYDRVKDQVPPYQNGYEVPA